MILSFYFVCLYGAGRVVRVVVPSISSGPPAARRQSQMPPKRRQAAARAVIGVVAAVVISVLAWRAWLHFDAAVLRAPRRLAAAHEAPVGAYSVGGASCWVERRSAKLFNYGVVESAQVQRLKPPHEDPGFKVVSTGSLHPYNSEDDRDGLHEHHRAFGNGDVKDGARTPPRSTVGAG